MATIKAIDSSSVHQIQSGQVIVDLNSVVKELVENSLDAGATSIDVRFKNHGLDSIEVQDNGKGIAPEDFAGIALKHHTSKLSSYDDLNHLETYGFRGEALSSLCALSKFHIVTARAEDGPLGKRLDFEISGKLKSVTIQAATKGTVVIVEDLFCNLPVRRKDLEKNIKREYNKVVHLLYAYACIGVGVRLSVTNQMSKGKRTPVFSTKQNTTTRDNIANVFGAKTLPALLRLDLDFEMESSRAGLSRLSTATTSDRTSKVKIEGHISRPIFGEGRQVPDRQMFFVNSRPCNLPQVSKAFNEVYKSFNVSQSPFIFANINLDTEAYDVNVSPDKRTIMLHDQAALLENLKISLTKLFEDVHHTIPQSLGSQQETAGSKTSLIRRQRSTLEENSTVSSGMDDGSNDDGEGSPEDALPTRANQELDTGSMQVSARSPTLRTLMGQSQDIPSRNNVVPEIEHEMAVIESPTKLDKNDMGHHHAATTSLRHIRNTGSRDEGAAHHSEIVDNTASKSNTLIEPDLFGNPYADLFSQKSPQSLVQSLRDSILGNSENKNRQPSVEHEPYKTVEQQHTISRSMPSFPKIKQDPVQSAFDRMRPLRTPQQIARITIGNHTTTAVIGSGTANKRRRIHDTKDPELVAQFTSSPLLTKELQNFAAPGSELHHYAGNESSDAADDLQNPHEIVDDGSERSEQFVDESSRSGSDVDDDGRNSISDNVNDEISPVPEGDLEDGDYIDESEKKAQEEAKVARLIEQAELAATRPTEANIRRASNILKNGLQRKEATLQLGQSVSTSVKEIKAHLLSNSSRPTRQCKPDSQEDTKDDKAIKENIDDSNAEAKLSLTIDKSDFERMSIVGQFNLGFILAVRPALSDQDEDELFIIDQHAADEKFNYERLQRTVSLESQRLVRPKRLELTAVEEEIILNHEAALKANGFEISKSHSPLAEGDTARMNNDSNDSNDSNHPTTFHLLTLPISGQKTFDLSDLEELLHLLSETPAGITEIPRPRKVQRMLAMRACRSSIMVGRTLTLSQMQRVVRHMGEMDKPWNCPHGRPTMRHLASLGKWKNWREGREIGTHFDALDAIPTAQVGAETDWNAWMREKGG